MGSSCEFAIGSPIRQRDVGTEVEIARHLVRRDGSGSVAHDDRMVLPDEEDRLIEAVVVRLLTDRLATVHRATFRPRIPNFVVLQWSHRVQQCPPRQAPTVR